MIFENKQPSKQKTTLQFLGRIFSLQPGKPGGRHVLGAGVSSAGLTRLASNGAKFVPGGEGAGAGAAGAGCGAVPAGS